MRALTTIRWAVIAAVCVAGTGCDDRADTNRASEPTTAAPEPAALSFGPRRVLAGHQEIDIRFASHGASLAGTLFLPTDTGPHPAVVWVHASGPHERLGYGALVDATVDRGLAFFSYDKRGVGDSEGACCPADEQDAGAAEFGEQADDALAALEAVRARPEIDAGHVGFLGVSQAGWIVPMAARGATHAAYVVLASGPTVTTGEEQYYSELTGDADLADASPQELSRLLAEHGSSGFDPRPYLADMSVPGLWLFGAEDGSIPTTESQAVLDDLRAQDKDFSYVVFPDAGHGLLDDAPPPPPEVLPTILDWITAHVA